MSPFATGKVGASMQMIRFGTRVTAAGERILANERDQYLSGTARTIWYCRAEGRPMVQIRILYSPDKSVAAGRLAEAIEAAGYTVSQDEIAVPDRLGEAVADSLAAPAALLIWSRPLVSAALVQGSLPQLRQQRNLIEVSADGITPPSVADEARCILISGWRGQSFHPGWQRILAEIKRLCGTQHPGPQAASAPRSTRPVQRVKAEGGSGAGARPGRAGRWALLAALALAVVAAAAWTLLGRGNEGFKPVVSRRERTFLPQAHVAPARPHAVPAIVGSAPLRSAPAGTAPSDAAHPPPPPMTVEARREAPDASPSPARKPRKHIASAPLPLKKYSSKNSGVMRLFCQRIGRSTPECRIFLHSIHSPSR
jgi:hypothetical protein